MSNTNYAYFIESPRVAEDLRVLHPVELEREYEIVKTVTLPKIDYENFTTDMLADRWFLEENAHLCSQSPTIRCILVRQRGKDVPDGADVGLAAMLLS